MRKLELKVFAALSYIPFGIVLVFFSVHILIRAALVLSVVPSIIVGLKSSKKNDVWENIYFFIDSWLVASVRIELALLGIFTLMSTMIQFLVLAVIIAFPLLFFGVTLWFFLASSVTLEE